MNLSFTITPKFPCTFPNLHSTNQRPQPNFRISASRTTIPARDRVIDFGKHKGKMLGTLPSTYLKWVSKNLRARDFEEWANLADEVLIDPIYRDRIEWEFAEKLLNGNSPKEAASNDAVSELLEISERFGWDNQNKGGWSKIDFGLLGTSKSGRIPRLRGDKIEIEIEGLEKKKKKGIDSEEDGGKRRERRERLRQRQQRGTTSSASGTTTRSKGFENQEQEGREIGGGPFPVSTVENPFPGREALLKKVLNRRKVI